MFLLFIVIVVCCCYGFARLRFMVFVVIAFEIYLAYSLLRGGRSRVGLFDGCCVSCLTF